MTIRERWAVHPTLLHDLGQQVWFLPLCHAPVNSTIHLRRATGVIDERGAL